MRRIIHIVGLQKSGTSLLVRLLENSGLAHFLGGRGKTEGGIDWGNRPSFTPTAFPAGVIYQRTGGNRGHEIDETDATPDVIDHVRGDVAKSLNCLQAEFGISKCPYSSVRLPWIKAILPDLFLVAIVRKPAPNVFSLLKRFASDRGLKGPEDGWWGVKPGGWRKMILSDKVTQIANQWSEVNRRLWLGRSLVDHFVCYDALCAKPTESVETILRSAGGERITLEREFPRLRDCDDEYLRGGELQPKRSRWIETNELVLQEGEPVEVGPLSPDEMDRITSICGDQAHLLETV